MERWEPGVITFAKRNPNYWKDGRAHFYEAESVLHLKRSLIKLWGKSSRWKNRLAVR